MAPYPSEWAPGLFHVTVTQRIRTIVGTCYHHTARFEIARLRLVEITPEKARGANHDSRLLLAGDCADLPEVKRIRIRHHCHPVPERHPEVDRKAKYVIEDKIGKYLIFTRDTYIIAEALDIRNQVSVSQRYCLGIFLAPAEVEIIIPMTPFSYQLNFELRMSAPISALE